MTEIVSIVVTYNRCELLKECVEALIASDIKTDILVVDNASTDNTRKIISEFPQVLYINTKKNIGGAGGFNCGLKKAYELGYKYFWIMDDDTIVKHDTLSQLVKQSIRLNNDFGFLSSIAYWIDDSLCVMNMHTIKKDWYLREDLIKSGLVSVKYASFVSLFIGRETIEQVGYPIKEYFIWGDDTEYTSRISNFKTSYLCADSEVVHKMNKNEGTGLFIEMKDPKRIERMFYAFRNTMCTKRFIGNQAYILYILSLIYLSLKVIFSPYGYKWLKVKAIYKGMISGLYFKPRIEYPK